MKPVIGCLLLPGTGKRGCTGTCSQRKNQRSRQKRIQTVSAPRTKITGPCTYNIPGAAGARCNPDRAAGESHLQATSSVAIISPLQDGAVPKAHAEMSEKNRRRSCCGEEKKEPVKQLNPGKACWYHVASPELRLICAIARSRKNLSGSGILKASAMHVFFFQTRHVTLCVLNF